MRVTRLVAGRGVGDRISGRPLQSAWADPIVSPVPIFEGGDSPATLRNVVTSLEAILPNATKRTLAGQGHGAPANVLAPILESFYGGEFVGARRPSE